MLDAASDPKNVEEYEEYTTEWIVGITGGPDAADEVAERLGFINEGLVANFLTATLTSALRWRGKARLTYVTLLQVSKDEQILYRFVVRDEEAAMLVPLSEPDQNKTRKLLAEKDVRQIPQDQCVFVSKLACTIRSVKSRRKYIINPRPACAAKVIYSKPSWFVCVCLCLCVSVCVCVDACSGTTGYEAAY